MLRLTFLGTGTSHGVPMIGCTCPVCQSTDPRNTRRRASVYIRSETTHIVIDTTPDFRMQALDTPIERVDGLLITHTHADHIFGFDDLRRFFYLQDAPIAVYGSSQTIETMNRIFPYVHNDRPDGTSILRVSFNVVSAPFMIGDITVTPLPVHHGSWLIYGYRLDHNGSSIIYIPDCSGIPPPTMQIIRPADVMILDGLRHRPHPTHFCVEQSLECFRKAQAKRGFLTHVCHDLEHETTQAALPEHVWLAYDGLEIVY